MKNQLYLAHLYPDHLDFPGDADNPKFLQKIALKQGFNLTIDCLSIGDHFDPEKYDFAFIGGGPDEAQRRISEDLINIKGVAIRQAVEDWMVMLCICGGYQLMGRRYVDLSGYEMQGLGIFDMETIAEAECVSGDLKFEVNLPLKNKVLLGMEDHAGRTYLGTGVEPLGKVITGCGNNCLDNTEGAQYKNIFGTYAHGSFLPHNPQIADYFLSLALRRKGNEPEVPQQ